MDGQSGRPSASWTLRALRTLTAPRTRAMTPARRSRESSDTSQWTHRSGHPGVAACNSRDHRQCHRPCRGFGDVRPTRSRPQAGAKCTCRWGLYREALCHCGAKSVRSLGGSGEAQRTSHLRGSSEAMGGRAVFCLAAKVPPALEELRKKAQYQSANGGACLYDANPKKIVNRF